MPAAPSTPGTNAKPGRPRFCIARNRGAAGHRGSHWPVAWRCASCEPSRCQVAPALPSGPVQPGPDRVDLAGVVLDAQRRGADAPVGSFCSRCTSPRKRSSSGNPTAHGQMLCNALTRACGSGERSRASTASRSGARWQRRRLYRATAALWDPRSRPHEAFCRPADAPIIRIRRRSTAVADLIHADQIGGYLRIAADQRQSLSVIRCLAIRPPAGRGSAR